MVRKIKRFALIRRGEIKWCPKNNQIFARCNSTGAFMLFVVAAYYSKDKFILQLPKFTVKHAPLNSKTRKTGTNLTKR